MENKHSKKELRRKLRTTMRDAINSLELPMANRRVKKLIKRDSRRLADVFASLLKKQARKDRKARKSVTLLENGHGPKKKEKQGAEVVA